MISSLLAKSPRTIKSIAVEHVSPCCNHTFRALAVMNDGDQLTIRKVLADGMREVCKVRSQETFINVIR